MRDKCRKIAIIAVVCLAVIGLAVGVANKDVLETKNIQKQKVALMLNGEKSLCIGMKKGLIYVPELVLMDSSEVHTSSGGKLNIRETMGILDLPEDYIRDGYNVFGYDCFKVTVVISDKNPSGFYWKTYFISLDENKEPFLLASFDSAGFGVIDFDGDGINELAAYDKYNTEEEDLLVFANIDGKIKVAGANEYFSRVVPSEYENGSHARLKMVSRDMEMQMHPEYELVSLIQGEQKAKIVLTTNGPTYEITEPLTQMKFE